MSDSANNRSEEIVAHSGDNDDGGGDGDRKKGKRYGFTRNFRKGKRDSLFRLSKSEKQQINRKNKRVSNPSSSIGCLGKRVSDGGGCYGCFRQTPTLESPIEKQTSDPNSPEFTYGLLRVLIETNDFYSKSSNPHLDIDRANEN